MLCEWLALADGSSVSARSICLGSGRGVWVDPRRLKVSPRWRLVEDECLSE